MRAPDIAQLGELIKCWSTQLGFAHTAFSDLHLDQAERRLQTWLAKNFHGEMKYMARHGVKRTRPAELIPHTLSVISVRMDYLPEPMHIAEQTLANPRRGYIARYALGRDYHKVIRRRLQKLATRIQQEIGDFGYRAFCDSAPVMEKALAEKSGHGWLGKHTNILNRDRGSWFFLGELYTDLPLPAEPPTPAHCGTCTACMDICPTRAIVAPYQLDARRCISYLTIELRGAIPLQFRNAIGNRVFGCDDCQLVCPWNKYARLTREKDFAPRHGLADAELTELFAWDETDFNNYTAGSALRRLGHTRWLRNIAVALGNAPTAPDIIRALQSRLDHPSEMVREHVKWGLAQHK